MTASETAARPRPGALLIATDLSARCDRAFDRAVKLAAAWNARLVALTVVENSQEGEPFIAEAPSWRHPPDAAERAARRLEAHAAGVAVDIETVVERGNAAEVIARVAAEHGCDLIIGGIPRDETLARYGLGSTVERLLRATTIPVLIVRQRACGDYRNIVAGTDFTSHARHALETAVRWFPKSRMTVLHAFDLPFSGMVPDREAYRRTFQQSAAAECEAFVAAADIPAESRRTITTLAELGAPERIIGHFVEEFDVGLVVLGSAGRSAPLEFVVGNTATQVLSRVTCDALIVREP